MTPFQQQCIASIVNFLKKNISKEEFKFEEKKGKSETYYVYEFNIGKNIIEIFVYDDEVGFMINRKVWFISEKWD